MRHPSPGKRYRMPSGSIRSMMTQTLFPPLEPYQQGMLDVGDGHRLYFEECGDPAGVPVIFLHGGPGSGCSANHRRFFDPRRYRIVLFDQRGCGRSVPRGCLHHNTTAHLVADIERLRKHLGIDAWLVFGGSWGSSLALAYAAAHKSACKGLLVRGIFLTGQADLEWMFQQTAQLLPEEWQRFAAVAPKRRRRALLDWLGKTLEKASREEALKAVLAWVRFEDAAMRYGSAVPEPVVPGEVDASEAERLLDKYRLQAHYLLRRCFLGEAVVLDAAARCQGMPVLILHGRLDVVCRPENAWRLHRTLHSSAFRMVEATGHSPFDVPMATALVSATNHFAAQGDFAGWPG